MRPRRVLLAKPGLDGHDRGIRVLGMALRDAGAEVIYLGQRKTANEILKAAMEEDVDVIGLSILSGAHLSLTRDLLEKRDSSGVDVPVVVGGTIPSDDVKKMTQWGVDEVFPSGSDLDVVVERVLDVAGGKRSTAPSPRVAPRTEFKTNWGLSVGDVYGPGDVTGLDPSSDLGMPGSPPFTRGPYETMYRGQLWTMRQFAGFGSAEDANARFRFLLNEGQTALSVAFDLPTQLGYDSDHPLAVSEVGRVGVAIDSAEDMVDLFEGIPLDQVSVNLTINATAPVILAFFLVAADRQGVPREALSGTIQNDILKEFLARKAFLFPPDASMRLATDVVEWASQYLPRFNAISITGYHAREAGCNAVQELGLTMASAIAYCEAMLARGLEIDEFAPRLSFHFATTLNLFEEVAKLRAARRMWHRLVTERFDAKDPRSGRLRFFSGNSGTTLTAAQPLNNIVRSTIQCLGAVLGGAQSIHVMGYDEAFQIPSEDAVRLALRTQQILAYETGVADTADPLGGSYYVEFLTSEIEDGATEVLNEVQELGGAIDALSQGIPQRWIAEEAYRLARRTADGAAVKVGVNRYVDAEDVDNDFAVFSVSADVVERQLSRLDKARRRRSAGSETALQHVRQLASTETNIMPALIEAASAGATLGEIVEVFREEYGAFEEPAPW